MRWATSLRYLSLRYWAITAPTWPSAKYIRRGGVPQVPARQRKQPRRRGAVAGKVLGSLAERRPAGAFPGRDDPELGPIRNATTIFATTRRTPRASSARSGPTSGAPTRGMLSKAITNVNIHRIVRRGFIYGPMLPEGAMEDDGVDRG